MHSASYLELKQLITDAGLMNRQPRYYAIKVFLLFSMLTLSISLVVLAPHHFWLQALNAIFLAFVFVQVGLIMHDAGHSQIFKSVKKNRMCGYIAANLIIATSLEKWTTKHNLHHAYPNNINLDPDVNMPILSFSEEQALKSTGVARFIVKHQVRLWFLLLSLHGFYWRILNLVKVVRGLTGGKNEYTSKHPLVEAILVAASNLFYFSTLFFFLDTWLAIVFIVVHHALVGLYMASIFATNHKGMPFSQEEMDFLYVQTVTSRNVTGGAVTDFLMGGLNYQIEHHLFPTMPRNNLRKSQKIIRPYCIEHGLAYYETDFFSSYRELLQNFAKISIVLKKPVAN